VGPRACLNATEKRQISFPFRESDPGGPALSLVALTIAISQIYTETKIVNLIRKLSYMYLVFICWAFHQRRRKIHCRDELQVVQTRSIGMSN
jgi:hypothetical protein